MAGHYDMESVVTEAEKYFPGIRGFSHLPSFKREEAIQEAYRKHKDSTDLKDVVDVYTGIDEATKALRKRNWRAQDKALNSVRAVLQKRLTQGLR